MKTSSPRDPVSRIRLDLRRAIGYALVAFIAIPAFSAQASDSLELRPDFEFKLPVMIVFFIALIFPVNQLIFKPIFAALDERASRIAGARRRADHIAQEADKVLARYESSIRRARAESDASRKETIQGARAEQASLAKAARDEASATLERTRSELEAALTDARESLRTTSRDLATSAAERVLGRTI